MRSGWILAVVIGVSLYFNARYYSASRQQLKVNDEQAAEIARLQQELKQEKAMTQARREQEEQAVAQLKESLAQARSDLDSTGQRLHSIQNAMNDRRETAALEEKLAEQRSVVQDLEAQLKVTQARVAQTSSEGNLAQGQNKTNQRLGDEQMKAQIAAQEQTIKGLQAQISDLRKRRYDFDASRQADQLQTQVDAQKVALTQLKGQREYVAQQWEGQKNLTQLQTQSQQQGLKTSEAQLGQQIAEQKAVSQQLERELADAKQSKASQKATISGLQGEYQRLQDQVKDLQSQLSQHEARLKELQ